MSGPNERGEGDRHAGGRLGGRAVGAQRVLRHKRVKMVRALCPVSVTGIRRDKFNQHLGDLKSIMDKQIPASDVLAYRLQDRGLPPAPGLRAPWGRSRGLLEVTQNFNMQIHKIRGESLPQVPVPPESESPEWQVRRYRQQ